MRTKIVFPAAVFPSVTVITRSKPTVLRRIAELRAPPFVAVTPVIAGLIFLSVSNAVGSTDFTGSWVLDLHSSSSPDAMLKRLGVPWIERSLAATIQLKSTYTQSPSLLTIHTRGPAFARTELIRLDNQPETKDEKHTGRYTIRTRWSNHGAQLVSTISFRTKDGHDAQLVVVRQLTDGGKTLLLTQTLKIAGDSGTWMIRRVWRKH